jgi:hypothetical protein
MRAVNTLSDFAMGGVVRVEAHQQPMHVWRQRGQGIGREGNYPVIQIQGTKQPSYHRFAHRRHPTPNAEAEG